MVEIHWNTADSCYVLHSSILLPVPREVVFDFFSDAFQLERITPPWLKFRVITPAPILIQAGTLIDYRLRLRGVPIRWRTEISTWDPPFSFTDRQLKGPYYLWEHLHTFGTQDGGTLVTDEVRYRVPGGRLAHWLFVGSNLTKIFTYRREQMLELFGQPRHYELPDRQRPDSVQPSTAFSGSTKRLAGQADDR
ncbi:MAG: SRPBCC family protein [Fuerstiella sp.]